VKVSEIFYSISGEGIHAGIPTVFIRLTGCNLRCVYCDSRYAFEDGEELTLEQVKKRVYDFEPSPRRLLITGGEPLFQSDAAFLLVLHLQTAMRLVEIETNGSIDPPTWFSHVDSWSVDVKCPSSGSKAYGSFKPVWLKKLRRQDQLKFVVGAEEDLDFVRGFMNRTRLRPHILVSPIMNVSIDLSKAGVPDEIWYDVRWLQRVAEFCKEQNVRMSLQLHKIIYGDKRGV